MKGVHLKIHPHNFFKSIKYIDTVLPINITEETKSSLKDIHPSQIIMMPITIIMYQIKYSYQTIRGNPHESMKIIYMQEENEDTYILAEMLFNDTITKLNEKPYKAISNVKILEIVPMAKTLLAVE
jgi:hypothetical protein